MTHCTKDTLPTSQRFNKYQPNTEINYQTCLISPCLKKQKKQKHKQQQQQQNKKQQQQKTIQKDVIHFGCSAATKDAQNTNVE